MGLQIRRNSETQYLPIFESVIEEIPGGGIVAIADIPTAVEILDRGIVVGVASDGIYHVVKTAEVYADSDGTAIQVVPDIHNFKVGDYLANENGGNSVLITAIDTDTNAAYDTITVANALTVTDDDVLYQSTSAGASAAAKAYKYTPVGITKNQMELTKYTSGTGSTRQENISSAIVTRGTVNESIMPYKTTAAMKTSLTARINFR